MTVLRKTSTDEEEELARFINGTVCLEPEKQICPPGFVVDIWRKSPLINHDFKIRPESPCVFAPDSKVMLFWETVVYVFILWTLIVSPYEILCRYIWKWVRTVDLACCFAFSLDIVVTLNVSFEQQTALGTFHVKDRVKILKRYLQGWMIPDIISAFPFELIGNSEETDSIAAAQESHGLGKALRVRKYLRMARLVRVARLQRSALRGQLNLNFAALTMIKLLFMTGCFCHWLACMWGGLGKIEGQHTWIESLVKSKGGLSEESFGTAAEIYLWSVYYAVTLITTVGLGDVTAQTNSEAILSIVGIFAGSVLWAYILSSLFTVLSRIDPYRSEYEKRMDQVNHMIDDHNLPDDLRFDIRRYFAESEELWKIIDRQKSISRRVSPQLKRRIALATSHRWLQKVPYFRNVVCDSKAVDSTAFIAEVACHLEAKIFAAGEALSEPAIYIVRKGVLIQGGRLLSVGDVTGQDLLIHNPENRSGFVPLALTITGTLALSQVDLRNILAQYPAQSRSIRSYSAWLALRGGLKRCLTQLAMIKSLHNISGLMDSLNLGTIDNKDQIQRPVRLETSQQNSPIDRLCTSLAATKHVNTSHVLAVIRTLDFSMAQKFEALGARLEQLERQIYCSPGKIHLAMGPPAVSMPLELYGL